tara:strand:+ start:255 stop:464 length:210 start_codon:yes stop_codon:yes gene_type:complete
MTKKMNKIINTSWLSTLLFLSIFVLSFSVKSEEEIDNVDKKKLLDKEFIVIQPKIRISKDRDLDLPNDI